MVADAREAGADRVRETRLPDGRRLTIRPYEARDLDGLVHLYDALSLDDRHRRFFSVYRPSQPIVEHYVEHAGGGRGRVLVAVVANGDGELVGEASYFRLPDGNAEFAITLGAGRRGWLGAYLLDALVELAAAEGIPHLEADVLLENRAMWALVRSRGFVYLSGPTSGVNRVAIAAARPLDAPAQPTPARATR